VPHQFALRTLFAALVLAALLSLCAILVATSPTAHLTPISPKQVQVFTPSELGLPRQAAAADSIYSLARKRVLQKSSGTQFHISLDKLKLSNSQTGGILVSAMGAEGTLFLNAIGISQSSPQAAPSFTRGQHWLFAFLPDSVAFNGQSRLDLVVTGDNVWKIGIGGIKTGTQMQIKRAIDGERLAQQWRLVVFTVVGILGLAFSFFCMIIGRMFWVGLSGLSFSAVLLLWSIGSNVNLGILAINGGLVAYLTATITALLATRTLSGRLSGIWLGFGIFALLGAISTLWGWRLGWSFDLIAVLSELAPVALCGFALPLCVIVTANELVKERAGAQAEAVRQSAIVRLQGEELERQADREAVTEERKRFARDIHDGIGGQLVSLLWRVRAEPIPQEELAAEIEQGLADLRLVVDALEEGPVSLPIALANFAYRARAQLSAADIAFEWDLPRDFDVTWSDSRQILSLYRILQETVSNVMRHAQAKKLAIHFRGSEVDFPDTIQVIIEDDGLGFDPVATPAGRGLANMKTRAAQIGGEFAVTSPVFPVAAPVYGTRIVISLPATNASVLTKSR
jgi:signal transduction histidine kinase